MKLGKGPQENPPPRPRAKRQGSKGRVEGQGQGRDRTEARARARARAHTRLLPGIPPPPHTMGSRRLALRRDQLGGFSQRICHPSSCRSGGGWRGIWDEGKICPRRIASAPPSCRLRAGGHPESAWTPGPSPAAAAPTCLWGRGQRGGPDVTCGISQSELPFPSPKGIPGPKPGPRAQHGSDDPQPGFKGGRAPFRGNRGWAPPGRRPHPDERLPSGLSPALPREGQGAAGVTQRDSEAQSTDGGGGLAGSGAGFPLPAGARTGLSLCPSPGPLRPLGPFWVSPGSDPGPQPRRAGQKVSVAAGARKTRTGFLPGRSRTGVQSCPPRPSRQGN